MPPALRDDTTLLTPSAQGEVFHVCAGDHGTDLQLLWFAGSDSSPLGTSPRPHFSCNSTSYVSPQGQDPHHPTGPGPAGTQSLVS